MILIPHGEDDVSAVVTQVIEDSISAVRAFPTITDDVKIINFDVPKKLGIGVSRGVASRLENENIILDYWGAPLNVSSRFMDLARPSGIVVDGKIGMSYLPQSITKLFNPATVFVRGFAESKGLPVFHTDDVILLPRNTRPFGKWEERKIEMTLEKWQEAQRETWGSTGFKVEEEVNQETLIGYVILPETDSRHEHKLKVTTKTEGNETGIKFSYEDFFKVVSSYPKGVKSNDIVGVIFRFQFL